MKFLLDDKDNLTYNFNHISKGNDNHFIDENVLIYDSCDYENCTHLVYLQKSGILNYKLFKDDKLSESEIGRFDTLSNKYYQISILIIKNKINLFYSFTNIINSNIYSLHHIVIDTGKLNKYNIIKYVSKKIDNSFVVHNDSSGNIHLLYNTVSENYSYIFYTYFNPYKNQWLTNPVKISTQETLAKSPMILVDSMDYIHATWWEKTSSGFNLKYKRMSSQGKDKYKWQSLNLSYTTPTLTKSSLYEKENRLYFDCETKLLISRDNGLTWTKEEPPLYNESLSKNSAIDTIEEEELHEKEDLSVNDYEQFIVNQDEVRNLIEFLIDENSTYKARFESLEKEIEELRQSKTGFKKFFFN